MKRPSALVVRPKSAQRPIVTADDARRERLMVALREFASSQRSPDTRRTFASALKRYREFLADRGVDELSATTGDVIAYRDARLQSGKAASTVALDLSVVRRFYAFLREQGVMDRSPAAFVKAPRVSDESSRGALTIEESQRLLAAPDPATLIGLRDRAMLALLIVNGLRLIELSRARMGDIMRDALGTRVLVVTGKGGRRDDVKLRDDVARALDAWTARAALEFPGRGKDAPVFPALTSGDGSRRGEAIGTRAIRARVSALLRTAGLRDAGVSAHWLRHTSVTLAITHGADLLSAQTAARHRDPKTTQRYFHALAKHQDSAVDRVPVRVA